MIKVSVMYPHTEGARFDMNYYAGRHMPMVEQALGSALKGWSVERGLAGGKPGAPAPYVAIGSMLFESVEAYQAAFAPHGRKMAEDLPNYTDIRPVMQISQVD